MTEATRPRRSIEEQQKIETTMCSFFEQDVRFNAVLGLKVLSVDPQRPVMAFDMRPELVGSPHSQRLHGGVIAAALDTVAGFAVTMAIAEKYAHESYDEFTHRLPRIGTIDLRTDFLAQGIGQRFIASATITRLGGRLASVQMRLESEGVLVATGAASYIVS